jgi:hypothetical protein
MTMLHLRALFVSAALASTACAMSIDKAIADIDKVTEDLSMTKTAVDKLSTATDVFNNPKVSYLVGSTVHLNLIMIGVLRPLHTALYAIQNVNLESQDNDVYDENEQRQLCDAYSRACLRTLSETRELLLTLSQCTQIHQGLLTSFLDKKSVFEGAAKGSTVFKLISDDETLTDSMVFSVVSKAQVCQSELAEPTQNLNVGFKEVLEAYENSL